MTTDKAKKHTQKALGALLLIALLCVTAIVSRNWLLWGDNIVEETHYTVESDRLPSAFDGFRIAQVSDLHNDTLGDNNAQLLSLLRDVQPDIIAVTGDLIDCRTPDTEISLAFIEKALAIAPVYYVNGNHEIALYNTYPPFEKEMKELGVTVLNNEAVTLTKDGSEITLLGLADPNTETLTADGRIALMKKYTQDHFTVVLSHRPELFEEYVLASADFVLTGHAHGGQVRLPFIGGLYAPGQGLLPVYDAGMFKKDTTAMLVSRGIGNSLFPLRFNNRPELPVIVLQTSALG